MLEKSASKIKFAIIFFYSSTAASHLQRAVAEGLPLRYIPSPRMVTLANHSSGNLTS